jgi:hypothetical protein
MILSCHQTIGQNHFITVVANKSFENVTKLKYMGKMVTNQNCINEEIMGRLNSGNACYHAICIAW